MAKTLKEWVNTDVKSVKDRTIKWLSQHYFFRDPLRPVYSDLSFFFSPADGIILYQKRVKPHESIVDIKGKNYSLQDSMIDYSYNEESIVVGIFMTFYDVHINRIPFSGHLSYKQLERIDSHNYPMLYVERHIIEDLMVNTKKADYLYSNQRTLNKIFAPKLKQFYYILQVADFDVDVIIPFQLKQNFPFHQNQRFSQVRYGSQVDLIIPISKLYDFEFTQEEGMHVEAGIDTLIKINEKFE